jgi:hypothetical protein
MMTSNGWQNARGEVSCKTMFGMLGIIVMILLITRPSLSQREAAAGKVDSPPKAQALNTPPVKQNSIGTTATTTTQPVAKTKPLGPDPQPLDFSMLAKTSLIDPKNTGAASPLYSEEMARLAGHQVRITGFMTPYDDMENLRSFILGARLIGCFFCAMPAPTQIALVRQAGKEKRVYIDGPIEVTGTIKFWKEHSPDDQDLESFVYVIDNATVKAVNADK